MSDVDTASGAHAAGAGGTDHDPRPFPERYRKALADGQLQRNLRTFQRSWRESRASVFAAYADNPAAPATAPATAYTGMPVADTPGGAEFAALRDRMAAI